MPIQDAPDGTVWIEQVTVVVDTPTPPAPAHETAAGAAGNYSGVHETYQVVATWTVTALTIGELKEILILSDDYDHTEIRIIVGVKTWCTGWNPQDAMPIVFEDLRLAAGTIVTVEAQSDDGTAIDVDAIIVGKEIG